jgi:hypothetical protein
MTAIRAASSSRSTVHHQAAKGVRWARDTMDELLETDRIRVRLWLRRR